MEQTCPSTPAAEQQCPALYCPLLTRSPYREAVAPCPNHRVFAAGGVSYLALSVFTHVPNRARLIPLGGFAILGLVVGALGWLAFSYGGRRD